MSNHSRDLPNSRLIVQDLGPSSLGFASWDDVGKTGRIATLVGLIFTLDQHPEQYNFLTIFSPWVVPTWVELLKFEDNSG